MQMSSWSPCGRLASSESPAPSLDQAGQRQSPCKCCLSKNFLTEMARIRVLFWKVPATLASEWVSSKYLPPLEMKSSMMRGLGPPGGSSGR